MAERLSERERISLLMMRGWGDRERSYNEIVRLFNYEFRNGDGQNQISKSTVSRTIARFHETGSVKNRPIPGRPVAVIDEDKKINVALSFIEDPHASIRKVSQNHDISMKSVHRILKVVKFHPYKIRLVHELNDDDPDRRNEFSELMMDHINRDLTFHHRIVFSDESTFTLNGEVNRQNWRYWSDENPHWMSEHHTQYPQKVNVWAGIYDDSIIGPFFIDGDLNAAKYETLLRDQIIPSIREKVGENFVDTWFQQDGAPAHYGRNVRTLLDQVFPRHWIGRRGAIEWPARSPDLSPLDYFLWGYLKGKVYKTKPADVNELRNHILEETALINRDMIKSAVSNFYDRIGQCQIVNGLQFEHLIN